MSSYARPLVTALSLDAASLSCNIQGSNTSSQCKEISRSCFFVNASEITIGEPVTLKPVFTNTILGIDNAGVRVTPLANTGLPGSGPITVGIPVGVHGVALELTATSGTYALNPYGLGVDVLGGTYMIGLP